MYRKHGKHRETNIWEARGHDDEDEIINYRPRLSTSVVERWGRTVWSVWRERRRETSWSRRWRLSAPSRTSLR